MRFLNIKPNTQIPKEFNEINFFWVLNEYISNSKYCIKGTFDKYHLNRQILADDSIPLGVLFSCRQIN